MATSNSSAPAPINRILPSPLPPHRRPTPIASHDQVWIDPNLFWESLQIFHHTIGSQLSVPVVDGKRLDLHYLYKQVTKWGGFHKVVSSHKWSEISMGLAFSPTCTSASYVLKRHYANLLYQYEEVYFSQPTIPVPTAPDTRGAVCFDAKVLTQQKFNCGYMVSLQVGSEVLRGVLYHRSHTGTVGPSVQTPVQVQAASVQQLSRRKRRKRCADPGRPKGNKSAYNFFYEEKYALWKASFPSRQRELTKVIGDAWNKLKSEDRTVYHRYAQQDKERYQNALKEHKEKLANAS